MVWYLLRKDAPNVGLCSEWCGFAVDGEWSDL